MKNCLNCHRSIDIHTKVSGCGNSSPGPGSITVCYYCGQLYVFDQEMKLRVLTSEEISEMKRSYPKVWKTVISIQNIILQRVKNN